MAEAVGVDLLARILVFLGQSRFPAEKVGRAGEVEMAQVMGMENFREDRRRLPVLRQHPLRQPRPARERPGKATETTAEEAVTPIRVRTRLS